MSNLVKRTSMGFTLIESVISIGLFAIIMAFSLNMISSIVRNTAKTNASLILEQTNNFVFLTIASDIQKAYSATVPSSTNLRLMQKDNSTATVHQIDYYIRASSGKGYISKTIDSGAEMYLTYFGYEGGVTVDTLNSTFMVYQPGKGSVYMKLILTTDFGGSSSSVFDGRSVIDQVVVLRGLY
jgi:type II secretory pathway pseudopilin PulG